ncbi:hypothetical protein FRX31_032601 [Thalictrum thalictroides]|uniref:Uncharacterized protein n=1 Tax=Thalictrum thalictroides TaxID=46969 RepID=A0A7J6UZD0_THATH|nr:hypothetical protein FRX31_032601 [Thalictrum thalictroides]
MTGLREEASCSAMSNISACNELQEKDVQGINKEKSKEAVENASYEPVDCNPPISDAPGSETCDGKGTDFKPTHNLKSVVSSNPGNSKTPTESRLYSCIIPLRKFNALGGHQTGQELEQTLPKRRAETGSLAIPYHPSCKRPAFPINESGRKLRTLDEIFGYAWPQDIDRNQVSGSESGYAGSSSLVTDQQANNCVNNIIEKQLMGGDFATDSVGNDQSPLKGGHEKIGKAEENKEEEPNP